MIPCPTQTGPEAGLGPRWGSMCLERRIDPLGNPRGARREQNVPLPQGLPRKAHHGREAQGPGNPPGPFFPFYTPLALRCLSGAARRSTPGRAGARTAPLRWQNWVETWRPTDCGELWGLGNHPSCCAFPNSWLLVTPGLWHKSGANFPYPYFYPRGVSPSVSVFRRAQSLSLPESGCPWEASRTVGGLLWTSHSRNSSWSD